MIDEGFSTARKWVGEMDPRLRLVFAVGFAFSVALNTQFASLTAALIISLIMVALSGVDWKLLTKRLLAFNGLVIFFWLSLPLTFSGETLFSWGWLSISRPGVLLAGRITLKSNAIMLVFITFVAVSPVFVMAQAMERMYVPKKLIHILLLTYRYVFVIEQEYQRLWRAIKARGFVPGTDLHTYRTYAYLLGMIFIRSADRAHRVHQAMLCRGFEGKFHSLYQFRFTRYDLTACFLFCIIILIIKVLEWM